MAAAADIPADWPEDVPFHRWPPFPPKPDGVTIISFSQFVATGLNPDHDEENPSVDQMGVPTTELLVRHDGEKKKRRRKKKGPNGEITEVSLDWWEELEDATGSRQTYSYNHSERYMDRLIEAWKDFLDKRRFPGHVMTVAQALGIFLGLTDPNIHVNPNKANKAEDDDAPANDAVPTADVGSDADSLSDGDAEPEAEVVLGEDGLPLSKVEEVTPEELAKLDPEAERERALDAFYNDPEQAMKLFLTSHAYDKGIYWNEGKLKDTPILVEAWFNFLEINSVFGPAEGNTKIRMAHAKKVAILAKDEMPHANKVARLFPDTWGKACGEIWGQNVVSGWVFGRLPSDVPPAPPREPTPDPVAPEPPVLPPDDPIHGDGIVFEPTQAELLADVIEPPSINGKQTEWSTGGGWGTSTGWGAGSGTEAWNTQGETDGENPTWDPSNFEDPPAEDPANIWGDFGPSGYEQLEALIGPNKLSETYVTLRVESSSRIIGSVVEPIAIPGSSSESNSFADIAQQKLARLTMLPSPYSNDAPPIGACVNRPTMLNPDIDQDRFGWVGPHNPLTDNITLLVQSDEHFLEPLRAGAGMTVTGIFIQVAELIDPKADENKELTENRTTEGEPPKKKKKKKGKGATSDYRSWWFFYQMGQVYPTFFAE